MEKRKNFISSAAETVFNGGDEYKTTVSEKRSAFPLFTVVSAVIITVLIMFIVLSFVRISETDAKLSELKSDITAMTQKSDILSSKISDKYSYSAIEEKCGEMGLGINSPETVDLTERPEGDITRLENRGNGESSRAFFSAIYSSFVKLVEFLD